MRTTQQTVPSASMRRAHALEDALDRLRHHRFIDSSGMAMHGPMGAEALSALGGDDAVPRWVDTYNRRYDAVGAPPAVARIDRRDPQSVALALGDAARLSDWLSYFRAELTESSWDDVVRAWVPRLLPGYGGMFTHGLLRTAHSVRILETVPQLPEAVDELAQGLALWAGTFRPLPGDPRLRGELALGRAIERLPRPAAPWGLAEAALFQRIDELAGLPDAVDALQEPAEPSAALSDLTATFAFMMLQHHDVHPYAFVHAITPIAGGRVLDRFLGEDSARERYRHHWHVDAAIAASFLPAVAPATVEIGDVPDRAELAARAIEHADTHVVKFTEACLREHALRPDPVYLAAAARLITSTPAW